MRDLQYVGLELNREYVELARKRLANALERIADELGLEHGTPIELKKVADLITDPRRTSKVQTATDALGRPRVPRGPRRKTRQAAGSPATPPARTAARTTTKTVTTAAAPKRRKSA